MSRSIVSGTRGYAERAATLVRKFESVPFEQKYQAEWHLLPPAPTRVLDVGAGTGVDAAWLAGRGHQVLAVEPTTAFRLAGRDLHPSPRIEWLDDALPALTRVLGRGHRYGLIVVSAVWMHLPPTEHADAMAVLSSLLAPDGLLLVSLRHGPAPAERSTHPVSAATTIALADRFGLECELDVETDSVQPDNRRAGVRWSHLAFRRPARLHAARGRHP